MVKIHKMFCIEEELQSKLGGINGSELVNKLLNEHFSEDYGKDEKKLRAIYDDFNAEKRLLLKKMKHISTILGQILKQKEKEKAKVMTEKGKEERKKLVAEHQRKYKNEEITEEEYWEFFD